MKASRSITHTEPRVVAGVFREALLTNREVLIKTKNFSNWNQITDIVENSSRDKTASRQLKLKDAPFELGTVEILIPFGRFYFSGTIEPTNVPGEFSLPDKITQSSNRITNRFKISPDSGWSKITLSQEDLTIIADFLPEEIGFASTKGLLSLPAGVDLRAEANIVGRLVTPKGTIRADGKVIRATELVSTEDKVFRVVIAKQLELPQNSEHLSERRSERRFQTNLPLTLRSEVLDKEIKIEILEVTSTTFRASPVDPRQIENIVFGVEYQLNQTSLYTHLVSKRDSEYIFEITSTDDKSSKWWFELYSGAIHPNIHTDEIHSNELVKLFCEAGAFSSNFIKGNRLASKSLLQGISQTSGAEWIHRWIEQRDGEITGHVSAIHLMKELWFIGDLVGGQSEANRISPDFMNSFFYAFTRYLKAFKPDHLVLMTWTHAHPYWTELERHISLKQNLIHSRTRCMYSRISGEEWAISVDPSMILRSEGGNAVENPFTDKESDLKELFDRFLRAYKTGLRREISGTLGGKVHSFNVFLSDRSINCFFVDLPDGGSVNKFPQSVFVFDANKKISAENWGSIRSTILAYCGKSALFPSSIRRVVGKDFGSKFESELVEMSLFIVQPELFDDYA